VAAGVEKMSTAPPTPVLAKALDAKREVPDGATLIGQNARLMQWYQERYQPPTDAFARFAVVAHENARHNANALFKAKQVTVDDVLQSRIINRPIRLFDCAPICDGAAAVVLVPTAMTQQYGDRSVRLRASGAATDRFRISDRADPLRLAAAEAAANKAFSIAGLEREDVSLFEPHDAFTIMTCLHLEASGFAKPGEGWKLAVEGAIARDGKLPLTTMGGLKARGHPIGATALYQVCEIVLQLTGQAGANQVEDARVAFMQSVGGAGATVIAHLFSR
jgi:acetyl-CoA C-acetyltransferase